ncbi:EutP/PduV family microcompartment system protein [Neobacillus massiliamazoniensis]|uniref:Ethanolamine utilization protein EutP n=1 Tax=Neobacillus massiliamazoniensis TaxID=1499688 RepID=A0A0U1NXF3_9BACI|nr:EutP/PduV family microcompartment system protein [Neobacillus massiliamazoniensis]CRK82709.1 ethanolamine utilization protein EutP [Neobacillus massiliamazoniensis]
MKKGKVMIIGPIGSGKSTLTKRLLEDSSPVTKTQALTYMDWIIDTPGEYSENPMFYRSLMATSLEAKILLVIQDATRHHQLLPPNFSQGFPLRSFGVITKIDHPDAHIEQAVQLLRQVLPLSEIFQVSSVTLEGMDELREAILKVI